MNPEGVVAVTVALGCLFALLTLSFWPTSPTAAAEDLLAGTPRWWQFRLVATIGIILSIAPSYVIYRLDGFLHVHEVFRYPLVVVLLGLEVLLIGAIAFWLARLVRHAVSEE